MCIVCVHMYVFCVCAPVCVCVYVCFMCVLCVHVCHCLCVIMCVYVCVCVCACECVHPQASNDNQPQLLSYHNKAQIRHSVCDLQNFLYLVSAQLKSLQDIRSSAGHILNALSRLCYHNLIVVGDLMLEVCYYAHVCVCHHVCTCVNFC